MKARHMKGVENIKDIKSGVVAEESMYIDRICKECKVMHMM